MDAFEVLEPGVLTTVQDLGRFGYSQFGIPPSGASDPFSLRVANLLVGNEEEEAGLEATVAGLKLRALGEVVIAITGGDLSPTLNGERLEMWQTHLLVAGDVIAFKALRSGCRAYLAMSGGIVVPEIMGSKSTYMAGGFGGIEGRALRRGDVLHVPGAPQAMDKLGVQFPREWIPAFEREALLRVIAGPQDFHFTKRGLRTFRFSSYRVTMHSDRMGIRLAGPRIERRLEVEESIISEGLVPGAIQVPGDERPMIILTELVTGGYTKIATVISTDLSKAAQLKPGDWVRFQTMSLDEAHQALRDEEDHLKKFKDVIRKR